MTFSKTTISGAVAAVSSFFALIALAPPELQNQIPQLFPEAYRGRVAIGLGLLAAFLKMYQSKHTADAPPGPKEGDAPK